MVARPISHNGRHTNSHHIRISEDLVHDAELGYDERILRRCYPTKAILLRPTIYHPTEYIARKDTDENVVQAVTAHDPMNKLWLVQWFGFDQTENTWENHANLKDVEAFHHYCTANKVNAFLPRAPTILK